MSISCKRCGYKPGLLMRVLLGPIDEEGHCDTCAVEVELAIARDTDRRARIDRVADMAAAVWLTGILNRGTDAADLREELIQQARAVGYTIAYRLVR